VGHVWSPRAEPGDAACRLGDHVGGGLCRAVRGLGQHAGVGVGDGDDAGMAEHLLDDFQVGVRGQGDCGGTVPQVVQPYWRQVELPGQLTEPVSEVLGPDRPPVSVSEHGAPFAPAGADAGARVTTALPGSPVPGRLVVLSHRLFGQSAGAGLVWRDGAAAGLAFGRAAVELAGQGVELPADGQLPGR
jgi:hypothetical protein